MAERKRYPKNNKEVIKSYGKHFIDEDDIKSVVKTLRSDFLTQGPTVRKFEEEIAKYCGVKYVVAVSSGTSALHIAYITAGLKKGDEVITTPNTFVATTNMLIALGVKLVFCDIRLDTKNIDESKIEKLITKKTKAIVPVHFAGHPCEMESILKIAKKYKLKVIEDACHSLGGEYKKKKIGSLKSDMTIFSFHPVKNIAMGEGGVVCTNDKKNYERLLKLRSHGIEKDKKGYNSMVELGYNYRITDIQTALGLSQLKKLNKFVSKRKKLADLYKEELRDERNIILPEEFKNSKSAWHIFVIQVKNPKYRDELIKFLNKNGVGTNIHYPNVYSHAFYKKNGYGNTKLENADLYHKTCITIPLHYQMEEVHVVFISKLIKDFFKHVK
ncbi:UDP-4-amino-4,6-dideoxy-N-acetyl-beta-L-altrosamine transaminase [Candidatus Nomurabacteria bacterium]|nr:UDP-4-amino-4,6-dideoxy-N-acetyl-beta-L-altrosamine transaminase [Candidatus Nomurabacteria bacterium]